MKKLFLLTFLMSPVILFGQAIATRNNPFTLARELYVQNSPGNTVFDSRLVESRLDSTSWKDSSLNAYIYSIRSSVNHGAVPGFVWSENTGRLRYSPLSQLTLPYSQLSGTPSIPAQFNPIAGTGISVSGTYPNITFTNTSPSASLSFNNSPSVTVQTVAAAANGTQLSATRPVMMNYSITISTTVSLAGNSTGYVVLEICSTNSSTAGDWVEIGRSASGQSGTLVVGLVLNQTGGGQVGGMLPAGWFRRVRSVNTSGTPVYTYNGGQEVTF